MTTEPRICSVSLMDGDRAAYVRALLAHRVHELSDDDIAQLELDLPVDEIVAVLDRMAERLNELEAKVTNLANLRD